IYNGLQGGGTVHMVNSAISGNTGCEQSCPGNSYPHGGGIYNTGSLTLVDSTVNDNTGIANGNGAGGGIVNWGTGVATLTNSTISNNTACKPVAGDNPCSGGGIEDAAPLTLVNSTVAGNLVCDPSGKASCTPYGGGIDNYGSQGTVSLTNTIVAKNFDAPGKPGPSPDCENPVTDGKPDPANPNNVVGNNLIGNNAGCDTSALTTHDQVGTPGAGIDPKLDPKGLHANGGPTLTIALETKSPAIGAGDPATCRLAKLTGGSAGPNGFDQRGRPRHAQNRNACDVGAYDSGGPRA
ncbi:MAG TPA: choice-of-anchor Q domain-containing protein, partial [Chloroflexota bacterium]|nr:choice-of-anchor Q domain-containing protein [Chloroflexota bacterium]